jgi:hypothetical protein
MRELKGGSSTGRRRRNTGNKIREREKVYSFYLFFPVERKKKQT